MSASAHQRSQSILSHANLEIVSSTTSPFTPEDRANALTKMHRDAYFSQSMVALTTGVFLVDFALQFQASNFIIGLLAAVPFLVQLLQLPGIGLVEKLRSRRRVCVLASLLSRLCLLPMVLTPWLPSHPLALMTLILSYMGHTGFGAISGCSWNSWMKDVVPEEKLGAFISKKLALITAITITFTMLGGYFLEFWGNHFSGFKIFGYSWLFGASLLAGLLGVLHLKSIPEPAVHRQRSHRLPMIRMLLEPFMDCNFRRVMIFLAGWNFAINLAAPFFTVYMLTMLHLPMALVTGITITNQVANLLFVRLWGRMTDRFSNKSVMAICGPIYIFCLLGWTFTTFPNPHAYTIPLVVILQILLGISTAGIVLASGNMGMKLAPACKSTEYMAANNIISSLAAGIAPILGGLCADFFAQQQLSLTFQWNTPGSHLNFKTLDIEYWDFLFAMAFAFGWMMLSRLKRIQEQGDTSMNIVMREFCLEVWLPFSTICNSLALFQDTRLKLVKVMSQITSYLSKRLSTGNQYAVGSASGNSAAQTDNSFP
jgi:MFS family permease